MVISRKLFFCIGFSISLIGGFIACFISGGFLNPRGNRDIVMMHLPGIAEPFPISLAAVVGVVIVIAGFYLMLASILIPSRIWYDKSPRMTLARMFEQNPRAAICVLLLLLVTMLAVFAPLHFIEDEIVAIVAAVFLAFFPALTYYRIWEQERAKLEKRSPSDELQG